ncbi:unnamed protein product [Chondrus crispus]|uniref:Integrase catalytic domain-containing protein n=1 Tax=Chondrus crispus TaxID=2769 RepID=R7QE19_CHOCR|nr:unnamed protein product [Chondrus crispus]CDF36767.1 unnamed protein product [Chondrus crispus]|eukprot:XP_005716586.1 unnamed protein product [Chondrus crispus]
MPPTTPVGDEASLPQSQQVGDDAPAPPAYTFMRGLTNDALTALTSAQKRFISSIRFLETTPDLTGIHLKRTVADMFPPASLFRQEICDLPAVHIELRNFLDAKGANLAQHSSHRVVMTLAHGLYEETEDTQAAIEMAREIIAAGRRQRPHAPSSSSHGEQSPVPRTSGSFSTPTEKVAHNVAMRMKEKEKKFSGDLGESWMEYVDDYLQISRDYNLSPPQRLQFLHNLLRGDAKRYYLDKIDGYATSFQQAIQMLEEEYNSPVRQTRVKNYLNSLRVTVFAAEGKEMSAALALTYKSIIIFSRQGPRSHQGDAHKVEFLRNAVVGMPWSSEPLSRVATHQLTFQQLYSELEAALQLDKESKIAIIRDHAQLNQRSVSHDSWAGILYTGQGRYYNNSPYPRERDQTSTRQPRFGGRAFRSPSTTKQKVKFNPLTVSGCFNCGGNHLLRDCTLPLNTSRAATRKMEYYAKKADTKPIAVHHVLADLCKQLDIGSVPEDDSEEETETTDITIFESILSGNDTTDDVDSTEHPTDSGCDAINHVYLTSKSWNVTVSDPFHGICIDSAAQKSVVGVEQAKAYCSLFNVPYSPSTSNAKNVFSFGTHKHLGLGLLTVRVPIAPTHFISLSVEVVDTNVPFLLGLDNMEKYKMVVDTDKGMLSSKLEGWQIRLRKKLGHLYYEWGPNILFTESELMKVHRHFHHPDSERLYSVMSRAEPDKTSPEVLRTLKRISSTCDLFQRRSRAPHRFRASLPDADVVFNRTLCLDLMYLENTPVLHVVDKDTKFSAAAFLGKETADATWNTFMNIWVCVYIGFPDAMATDQGPQFKSQRWKTLLLLAGIKHFQSGVQSHNALGVGERYHAFLRDIYRKVRLQHPGIERSHCLSLSLKAMNDTAGYHGLVPTLLVFGAMPRIPIVPMDLPAQMNRMKAMESARKEMASVMAKERLSRAVRMNVPSAADKDIVIGSRVLLYREKPEDQWTGPYLVLDVKDKSVTIQLEGKIMNTSIDKVKSYNSPPVIPDCTPLAVNIDDSYNFTADNEDVLRDIDTILERIRGTPPPAPNGFSDTARQDVNVPLSTPDMLTRNEITSETQALMTQVIDQSDIATKSSNSTRIIVSVSAIKGFRLFSHDVRQAYLQSEEKLTRKVFLLPKRADLKYFGLCEEDILELLKPIYGMTDAGDYWGVTVDRHVKRDLGLIWDNFEFFGTSIQTHADGSFSVTQEAYTKKLKHIPMDASFERFRSYRSVLAWIGYTRPDALCAINKAAQVTEKTFGIEKLKSFNCTVKHLKGTHSRCLNFYPLQKDSLHMRVYTDASFAGNDDLSSQLGFIILLCDTSDRAHILEYSSRKSKRVVRSILGGDVYAFASGFDRAFILRHDLETIFGMKIPLHMLTDSLQMFDVITKGSSTTEKRLMIDIASARECYNRQEISHVGLVSSEHNIADGLTKETPNNALERLISSGYDRNPVKKWIYRTQPSSAIGKVAV